MTDRARGPRLTRAVSRWRRRACAVPAVAAALWAWGAGAAAAQGADAINGYVELTRTNVSTTTQGPTGPAVDETSDTFLYRWNLAITKRLWPNLSLRFGGLFEKGVTDLDVVGQPSRRASETKQRPYIGLTLRTPLFLVDLSYDRSEDKQEQTTFPTLTMIRDQKFLTLGWRPVDWPRVTFQLFRTDSYDENRVVQDLTEDLAQLTSEYRPVQSLRLYYRGSLDDQNDRLNRNEVKTAIQSARVTYSDWFWRRRISVNSDYSITYRSAETTTSGQGEVVTPLIPFAGLSVISDTPEMIQLLPNVALIDGDLTANAGIDLGLPPAGGDARPRNIGLDFGADAEVNTLYVWVDRELRAEIVNFFSWRVYTSGDNLHWSLRETITPAPFGPFATRFEVRFANVTARYLKVVASPLTASWPFASDFPNIFVTEVQPALRRPAATAAGTFRTTSQVYTLDTRTRLLDRPGLYYELNYFYNKSGEARSRWTLSNGLSLQQVFNNVYSLAARVARENGREAEGLRTADVYSASLSAAPLAALRHNLVFSGKDEEIGDRRDEQNSVLLNTIAQFYRGVDVTAGVGKSHQWDSAAGNLDTTIINGGATLIPHPALTINLVFQDQTDHFTAPGAANRDVLNRSFEVSAGYRPLPTLYLFASRRLDRRTEQQDRTLHSYAGSWTPFPYGNLHINVSYTETYESVTNALERNFSPVLRWNLGARSYLDLAYQKLTTESIAQKIATRILSGTLHIAF